MPQSAIIVRDGEDNHRLLTTDRDTGLLFGPFFKEGVCFLNAFGVFDNFTVAGGISKGSRATRRGRVLHNAASALLAGINRDADLLCYDYSYGFANDPVRHGGGQTISIRGRSGIISTRPKGFCTIELFDSNNEGGPRIAEFIDLRIVGSVETDTSGAVKVYRRKAEMHWLETLPPLLEFLHPRLARELVVEHHDRAS